MIGMLRHRAWWIAAASLLLVVAALWSWNEREPQLLGHPLRYWVVPWEHSHRESPEAVDAAIAAMDESHVPWMVRQLGWRRSTLRWACGSLLNAVGISASTQTPGDIREPVAMVLGRMGSRAAAAIPDLERLAASDPGFGGAAARAAAQSALIQLGRGDRAGWIALARAPTHSGWWHAVEVLTRLGTNAPETPSLLLPIMLGTNAAGYRINATRLYAHAAPRDAGSVSNLALAVRDPVTRLEALRYLAYWGPRAEGAAPAIAEALVDARSDIRRQATNAWRQVCPGSPPVAPTTESAPAAGLAPAPAVR
jgi:hypothetical protein